MESELMTISQVAQYLKVSDKTVRRMINSGDLIAIKLSNRTWRIQESAVEECIRKKQLHSSL